MCALMQRRDAPGIILHYLFFMAYAKELRYYINVNFNWNRGFPRSLMLRTNASDRTRTPKKDDRLSNSVALILSRDLGSLSNRWFED